MMMDEYDATDHKKGRHLFQGTQIPKEIIWRMHLQSYLILKFLKNIGFVVY